MHCPKGEPASFAVEFSLMACRTDRKFFVRIRPNSVDSRDSNPDLRNHLKVPSSYANNPTVPRESMPRNRTLHINQSLLQRLRPACTFGVRGTPLYFLTPPQARPGALLSLLSGVTPRVLPLNCGPRVTPHSCGLGTQFFLFSASPFSSASSNIRPFHPGNSSRLLSFASLPFDSSSLSMMYTQRSSL